MNLLNEFKQYLLIQPNKASSTTVKNYLADVRKFVKWYELKFGRTFSASDVSSQNIVDFKEDSLSDYSALSVDRSLSSLRKLFTFLKLEGHISHSPFEQLEANKQQFIPDPWRLKDFKNYLYVYNASHLTIKNYVIDLRQFLSWVDEVTSPG
ncbi:MAG: site-specific integrase, partial [Candidatus Levybacteria bacterium]|nr:site-specific integrase [Candidatus Levybacteria bacterium]